jgi:hypothetical protein
LYFNSYLILSTCQTLPVNKINESAPEEKEATGRPTMKTCCIVESKKAERFKKETELMWLDGIQPCQ